MSMQHPQSALVAFFIGKLQLTYNKSTVSIPTISPGHRSNLLSNPFGGLDVLQHEEIFSLPPFSTMMMACSTSTNQLNPLS